MTTNFALKLSVEGIELLHRVPRGWQKVGVVDVEDPDLDTILADLRKKAIALEPGGLRTKIVIPMDQIKYMAIDSTLTTLGDIHAGLDGATPYALEDLVIDYEKSGGRTHIAAVAQETLIEAEAFARAHRFCPVCFVAVPEPFTFQKEVFFGPTAMMPEVLGPDGTVDRDALPVMTVGTRIKSRLLVFDIPEEELPPTSDYDLADLLAPFATDPDADEASTDGPEEDAEQDAEGAEAAEDVPVAAEQEEQVAPAPAWVDRIVPEVHVSMEPPSEPAVLEQPAPEMTEPTMWVDRIVAEVHPAKTAVPVSEIAQKVAVVAAAPVFAKLALMDQIIAEYHPAKEPETIVVAPLTAAAPPSSPAIPSLGAASRAPAPNPLAQSPAPRRRAPIYAAGAIAAGIAAAGVIAWSQMPATGPDVTAAPEASAPSSAPTIEIVDTLDVATAPVAEPDPEQAPNVPLLDLAALATPDADTENAIGPNGETGFSPGAGPAPFGEAALADAVPNPVQSAPAPPVEEEQQLQATIGAPVLRGRVLSPDEAMLIYRATGVWQRAPRIVDVPGETSTEGMIVPVTIPSPDEIAQPELPLFDDIVEDLSFIAPADPPPPDVVFPVDENGYILATPEGTLTPEGAIVFAGLPEFDVRVRPELNEDDLARMAALAPAPEGVVIVPGPPPITPPLRPVGAALPEVEDPADVTPGGVSLAALDPDGAVATTDEPGTDPVNAALAGLRPQLRPTGLTPPTDLPSNPDITSVIAGIAADEPPTPFIDMTSRAVDQSRRPVLRPANFARVVAAARERQAATPAPTPPAAATPTPAPQTAAVVAPQNYAPVPGGVARAATQEDVIRLREMNLIGVYGRPNARRALVRLPNGRYVRVEVGSALDGGQVTAIGDSALNYVKRGRTYALELPSG